MSIVWILIVIACAVGIWWSYPKLPAPMALFLVIAVAVISALGLLVAFGVIPSLRW